MFSCLKVTAVAMCIPFMHLLHIVAYIVILSLHHVGWFGLLFWFEDSGLNRQSACHKLA
jgi:hypothetical protein